MHIREFVTLHNLTAVGVMHVGAHEAEELSEYQEFGFGEKSPIIWVEAQAALAQKLKMRLDPAKNKIYQAVAWDKNGEKLNFNVTSKSASSSLFELGEHREVYPDIDIVEKIEVTTTRLDSILSDDDRFEFLVLDIQGAESKAIKGLGNLIDQVNWIYTEVSKRELYKDSTLFAEIESQLNSLGFKRVFTAWDRKAGWGDALYARKSVYSVTIIQRFRIINRRFGRYVRSFIPNSAFPFLVKIKSIIRKATKHG